MFFSAFLWEAVQDGDFLCVRSAPSTLTVIFSKVESDKLPENFNRSLIFNNDDKKTWNKEFINGRHNKSDFKYYDKYNKMVLNLQSEVEVVN